MSTGRGPLRRVVTAAFLALVAAGAWWLGGVSEGDAVRAGAPARAEEPRLTACELPRLEGRAGNEGSPSARRGTASGSDVAPLEEAALSPLLPTSVEVLQVAGFVAVDPRSVKDEVAPSAPSPVLLPRASLVGKVLPFGPLDRRDTGGVRWMGVATLVPGDVAEAKPAAADAPKETDEAPTTAVRGVVVGEDGTPVAGAELVLYSSFYLRQDFYDHRVREIGKVRTDGDGAFDLRPVALDTVHFGADGEVLVTVRAPGFATIVAQTLAGVVPGRESDVGRLAMTTQAASVHGVILDPAGKPVVGAAVRVSGTFNPVDYDKTERMIVLDDCPTALTDEEGRYALGGFAAGVHELSIHVRIDCVEHGSVRWDGDREWSPRVRAANEVRGRVVDPDGNPVAAAVVAGGGNWTPTNADGTFWLDNVDPGPLTLEVAHHAWHTRFVPNTATNGPEVTIALERRLSRVTLRVRDAKDAPVPLVAIDWAYAPDRPPGHFAPDSRYWNDPEGEFAVLVPENAVSATVSQSTGASRTLDAKDLLDGSTLDLRLE